MTDRKRLRMSSPMQSSPESSQHGDLSLREPKASENNTSGEDSDSDATVFDETDVCVVPNLDRMTTDQKIDVLIKKIFEMDQHLSVRMDKNEKRTAAVETKVEKVKEDLEDIENRVHELNKTVEDQTNRMRRNNVIFYGVPEGVEGEGHMSCEILIRSLIVDHMGLVDSNNWEIERAHRSPTGPPPAHGRTRPIVVKFLRYQNRVEVLRQAPRKLKDNNFQSARIYVSDDVSIAVRQERKKLIELKKRVKAKFPNRKVFIPPSVPAVLLRENSAGKLVRVALGTKLSTLD